LNHYTAMIWKSATEVGCYTAVRQTASGPFKVSDCRYSAGPQASAYGRQAPNTVGCAGDGQADGEQVPALVGGSCPKASGSPQDAPQPAPPAYAGGGQDCVPKGSLGKCDQCLSSDQCEDGRYCCPFMKKCVAGSHEKCFAPVALCVPPCSGNIESCTCKERNFPCGWAKPTCGGPPLNCPNGASQAMTPPPTAPPSLAASVPAPAAGAADAAWQLTPRLTQGGTTLRVPATDLEVKVMAPGAVPLASMAAVSLALTFGFWAVRTMLCSEAPRPAAPGQRYGPLLR